MGLSPADKKVSESLQGLADEIEKRLLEITGQRMAFSLVVFNTAPGSRLNYISNCKREEVAAAWTALLKGWGAGMPDIPAHEFQS